MKRIVLLALIVGFAALGQPYPMLRTDINGVLYTPTNFFTANVADILASLGIDAAATRSAFGLVIGTHVQAYDTDLADLADGSLSGSKVGTGVDGGNVTTGTVAAARIDSAIARLDSPAFINNPSVPTQSLSTSNTTAASTAFAQQLAELRQLTSTILTQLAALTNGSAGQVPTWTGANTLALSNAPAGGSGTDTNWNGSPIASGTITNLIAQLLNGHYAFVPQNGAIFAEGVQAITGNGNAFAPWQGIAMASGTVASDSPLVDDPGRMLATSASGANSGYGYYGGSSTHLLAGGEWFFVAWSTRETNAVVFRGGYLDVVSTSEPTDGVYVMQENGYLVGKNASNSVRTATSTSYQIQKSDSLIYRALGLLNPAGTGSTFWLSTNGVLAWSDSVTGNVPTGSGRFTASGMFGYHTGSAVTNLVSFGAIGVGSTRSLAR